MNTADQQIADILTKYGEPIAGNIWRVQGQAVIYHKALERIAAQAGIAFHPPTILRAEHDEAVILVTGSMGERTEWSIGEALVNVNYLVPGAESAYVYAMAEKRERSGDPEADRAARRGLVRGAPCRGQQPIKPEREHTCCRT